MTKNGWKVFDSDMHCVEPPDLWERFIDPDYKDRAPRTSEFAFRNALVYIEVEGRIMPWFAPVGANGASLPRVFQDRAMMEALRKQMEARPEVAGLARMQQARFADASQRKWSPATQLEAMDVEGVDVTVVFPTSGLLVLGVNEIAPDLAAAIARGYNNWLSTYVGQGPNRLYGAAMLAPHSVEEAVVEARRATQELGFKAVFMRPNLVHQRHWYDPYYDPLWQALADQNIPLVFHEGVGVHLPQAGDQFGSNIFLRHVACHSMEMMYAVMAMCGGGVLARHPKLRVGFFEANCGWVPWLLNRMDDHYEVQLGVSKRDLPEKPSTYFRNQCVVSVEADEHFVKQVIDSIGDDNLVMSTDWPHPDSKYPKGIESFLNLPIPEASKKKILWDNCAKFYSLG